MKTLQTTIEKTFAQRDQLSPHNTPAEIINAIDETINLLDAGKIRVAEKINNNWVTHEWIKKAILLFFKTHHNTIMDDGVAQFFDKIPPKFQNMNEKEFSESGVRVVPASHTRKGAFVGSNTIFNAVLCEYRRVY
jgi:2,3,4,5-tetrahydropyridine-2-carboxylate N-succinyltransferase